MDWARAFQGQERLDLVAAIGRVPQRQSSIPHTASYEAWLNVCKGEDAVTAVIDTKTGTAKSGVEAEKPISSVSNVLGSNEITITNVRILKQIADEAYEKMVEEP